ncbi:YggT family protein [Bombilactobacillus folatiphilus]|uniref:YggT family protein n=1 Tax=Bombilactobacillus folatiphilus TaxID=2923362 RepID=A0ABY4PB35_9LACO|nr:YggT family protein [Bombilactobacillus folatiphilus]UQS82883.1 YggT family protein [Bombilactobacillus folatiphilus]
MTLIYLIDIYEWLIIIWALLTWFPGASQSKLGVLLGNLVNPFLSIFDRIIPPILGISFSPVWAFLVLDLIKQLVYKIF